MKYPQLVSMPTAISDWLEEQLEARGIDAVVYTRYVLSILYRDPVDLFCSEQEPLFLQPNKEVRRSGGGRKRLRKPAPRCWSITDADQLKRSAAVQCLTSASDQECGFESLVDELCEKLKEVNKITSTTSTSLENLPSRRNRPKSPQDPTKRYFAAFPPLSRNNASGKSPYFLIPKWLGSPQKKKRNNISSSNRTKSEQSLHNRKMEPEYKKARNRKTEEENNNNTNESVTDFNGKFDLLGEEEYFKLPFDLQSLLDSPEPKNVLRDISLSPTEWTDAAILTEVATVFGDNTKAKQPAIPFGLELNSNNPWSQNYNPLTNPNWPIKWSLGIPQKSDKALQLINHSNSSGFSTDISRPDPPRFKPRRLFSDTLEEDLFNSDLSHFKPINEKDEEYEDGTTFPIDSRLDEIKFRRSESGFLYMEGDESGRKYLEFNRENFDGFVPKYLVKPEDTRVDSVSPFSDVSSAFEQELDFSENGTVLGDDDDDDEDDDDEVTFDEDLTGEKKKCDCQMDDDDVRMKWDDRLSPGDVGDGDLSKKIWGTFWGEPRCLCFQRRVGRADSKAKESKTLLKEESNDDDELFNQINIVMQRFNDELPHMEESVDISYLLNGMQTALNKRRRHSSINTDIAPREHSYFSFATHLEEDCVMKIAPMPTLRSITH